MAETQQKHLSDFSIKERNRKKYIDDFLQQAPVELQEEAYKSLSALVNMYTSNKKSNDVDIRPILNGTESSYIKTGIMELNHHLRFYTWKPEQEKFKDHVENLCPQYLSSPDQLPQARQVSPSN